MRRVSFAWLLVLVFFLALHPGAAFAEEEDEETSQDGGGGSGGSGGGGGGGGGGSGEPPIEGPRITVTGNKPEELPTVTLWVNYAPPPAVGGRGGEGGGGAGPGSAQTQNPGDTNQSSNADEKPQTCEEGGKTSIGNPVVFATGNKIEPERDFKSSGEGGLTLKRTYNSYWSGIGIFGRYWLSSFDAKLLMTSSSPASACYPKPGSTAVCDPTGQSIWAQRLDGRLIKFNYAGSNIWNEERAYPVARIVKNGNGTFTLYSEERGVETYDAAGFPLSMKNQQGVGWTFNWSAAHYLNSVSHNSGRTVTLTWSGNVLTNVTDPAGNVYSYAYAVNKFGAGQHLLTQTTQPGAANPSATGGTISITRTYHYEDTRFPWALTGVTLNNVRYSWFAYDAGARAIESRHTGTNDRYTFSYTLDGAGKVASATVTNPLGLQTTHYFQNGRKTASTATATASCPLSSTQITYDGNGNPSRFVNERGVATDTTYDVRGQLQQRVENATLIGGPSRTTTFAWDGNNRMTRSTVPGYRQTDVAYTADGRVASSTVTTLGSVGGAGRALTTSYSYSIQGNGLLSQRVVTGPLPGNTLTYAYNSSGDLVSVVNALGHTTSYGNYNALGLPGTVTGPNGDVTTISYGARGEVSRVTRLINGANSTTTYAYNAKGKVTDIWLPDGRRLSRAYDASYRLVNESELESSTSSAVSGKSNTVTRYTSYSYDDLGDVRSVTAQRNTVTWVKSCDAALTSDPTTSSSSSKQRQTTSSARAGSGGDTTSNGTVTCPTPVPTAVTETQTSLVRYFDYDSLGRLLAVRGNNGQNVRRGYDAVGNVISTTDSLNRTTYYGYDAFNRTTSSVDALATTTSIAYDPLDQVTQVTAPGGRITTFSTDGLGLTWQQNSPDTGTTNFAYDGYGRLTSMTRANGRVETYGYDVLGRITTKTAGGLQQIFNYDNCVNGKGRLCSFGDRSGSTGLAYKPHGLLTGRSATVSSVGVLAETYEYDSMDRLILRKNDTNGMQFSYTYALGKVSSISALIGGVWQTVVSNVGYDAAGAPSTWAHGNGLWRAVNRDLDGRKTGLSVGGNVQALGFGYDAADRITAITDSYVPSRNQTFGYDSLDRLVSIARPNLPTWSYAYDVNGNRTHQIEAADEWAAIAGGTNRMIVRGGHTYGHDANGNRASHAIGGSTMTFAYDEFNRLAISSRNAAVTYCDANGACPSHPATWANFAVNAAGQRVFKDSPLFGRLAFAYGGNNELQTEYAWTSGVWSDYVYLYGELVGMVRNGLLYQVHGDQLGRPHAVTNGGRAVVWQAYNQAFDRQVTLDTIGGLNIGLPGQYYDAETGYWNNGFRDYDSGIGRYIQSDPIGLAGGLNTYSYVGGNPLSYVDPQGLWLSTLGGCALGAIGGYLAGDQYVKAQAERAMAKSGKSGCDSKLGDSNPALTDAVGKLNDAVNAFGSMGARGAVGIALVGAGGAVSGIAGIGCGAAGAYVGATFGTGSFATALEGIKGVRLEIK